MSSKNLKEERWGSKLGFILVAAGSAIGLGNIWRFPYIMAQNGGAAFIIIYLGFVIFLGLSLLVAEIAIGRAGRGNGITAFVNIKSKKYGLIGLLGVIATILTLSFYSVVAGWTIAYFFKEGFGLLNFATSNDYVQSFTTFSSGYFAPIAYHFIFMFLTVFCVIWGVRSGIEKVTLFLMPLLFVLLFGLLIYSFFYLSKFSEAWHFYVHPNWSQITFKSVSVALGQALFTLSLGFSAMVTYGVYLDKKVSIGKSSAIVLILNTIVSLSAGLVIIPAVFTYSIPLTGGVGLTFMSLPLVFSHMVGGRLIGSLFFFLLFVAAITSSFSLIETGSAYFINKGINRKIAVSGVGIFCFVLGIAASYSLGPWASFKIFGLGVFDLLNDLASNILLPLNVLLLSLFVGWIAHKTIKDELLEGAKPNILYYIWNIIVKFVAPVVLLYILLKSLF